MASWSQIRGMQRLLGVAAATVLASLLAGASPAFAGSAWWRLSSIPAPTYLQLGTKEDPKEALIVVAASNLGDADAIGSAEAPITMTDTLPAGVVATSVSGQASFPGGKEGRKPMTCSVSASTITCTYAHDVPPFERLEIKIGVEVHEQPSAPNRVEVQGGGAPHTEPLERSLTVKNEPTPFGIENEQVEVTPENEGGSPDTQAGSHPFQLTTTLNLNETLKFFPIKEATLPAAPALLKDVHFSLPPGLLGNPRAVPQCSDAAFSVLLPEDRNACASDTAVGAALVTINEPVIFGYATEAVPLFNLVPAPGEPARFGFEVYNVPVVLDTAVQSGGDYRVEVKVSDASETAQILGTQVTFWGEPGDERHDASHGWKCLDNGAHNSPGETCSPPSPRPTTPFLTLPTSCPTIGPEQPEPLTTTVLADSWLEPGQLLEGGVIKDETEKAWKHGESKARGLQGCGSLPFSPSITTEPGTQAGSTPTGLTVQVDVPQASTLTAGQLAEADVKDTTVALPQGVELSPSAANGLQACSEAQVGFKGENPHTHMDEFTQTPANCPDASKVGLVHIRTPLLSHELEGAAYLAEQEHNPFGSLVAMYIVAQDPVSGVLVKLAGRVELNEQTLRVVTKFENTPQVPFEDLKLELFGGPRASVTTPPLCGAYSSNATFTPWATDELGNPRNVAVSSSPFNITSGPGGAPCSNPNPFAPGFSAQATNPQAGAFTPFNLVIGRPDADQAVTSLSMHLPPGLSGMLSSVTPCPEPLASKEECGPESLLGEGVEYTGLGPNPFKVTGSKVYITGPYKGAPYGLSIVTPAVAGPFNLGHVNDRATINVDPSTAALTITSDPFPTQLKGIPVQLQRIEITVNRPGFEFNPTNCSPMKIEATLTGGEGASAHLSSPFQVANCAMLPFHPTLTASTQAKTSKASGASLTVRVTSGPGQANIAKTKLAFPKAFPTRLTTLQKACVAAVFNVNPASCPAGSVIGTAVAHTPVLHKPLSGPAYLVSHGGAAFPDAEFVLQGEGITLILDGLTNIKNGVTSSTFNTVPDQPISTFETVLPEGPHSAFTALGNLCTQKLTMPTIITGQNGVQIKQNTAIVVSNCPVTIVGTKVVGHTAFLTIKTPSVGRVIGSGSNVNTVARRFNSAQNSASLQVPLSSAGRRKHKPLRVKIRVGFVPNAKGKPSSTAFTTVIFH
jgi:hypothetical protein